MDEHTDAYMQARIDTSNTMHFSYWRLSDCTVHKQV